MYDIVISTPVRTPQVLLEQKNYACERTRSIECFKSVEQNFRTNQQPPRVIFILCYQVPASSSR